MASHEQPQLPAELESDQEAAVLYSPFREKSLNPQSWSRKLKFWETLLARTAMERRIVTVDLSTLSLMFERKGIRPKCLGTVIEEMKKTGQIQSLDDYRKTNSWLSWGLHVFVKQPLNWGAGQLLGAANAGTGVYVYPQVVKKLCDEVMELTQANMQDESPGSLMSLAHLRNLCRPVIPSDADFDIVWSQLERDQKIAAVKSQDHETVIKCCKRGKASVSPVKEIDVQIYRIRATEKKLEEDIESLSLTADRLLSDAKTHVREGRKTMAKHCLRKKHAVMKTMDRRYAYISKLNDILQSIQNASTNDMVLQACSAGAAAMAMFNKQLTVEGVEAVMEKVTEAIEDQEAIQQALSSGLDEDDNQELEQDLQELLSADVDEMGQLPTPAGTSHQGVLPDVDSSQHQRLIAPLSSLTLADLELPSVPTHQPQHVRQQTAQLSFR